MTHKHNDTQHETPASHIDDVKRLTEEAHAHLEGWKRARADYENLHRRVADERMSAREDGMAAALAAFLPILDHLDAAVMHMPNDIKDHPWVDGIRHIQKAATQLLSAEGITVINETNVPLDPLKHEAVSSVASAQPKDTVVDIVSMGYQTANRVLRPARVTVSNGAAAKEADQAPI